MTILSALRAGSKAAVAIGHSRWDIENRVGELVLAELLVGVAGAVRAHPT